MKHGAEWRIVRKRDVMDECREIPGCTHYRINGKLTDVIPADMRGFDAIEPVYTVMKGWNSSTEGITAYGELPQPAREYLDFLERESGARIAMVSTGPDRNQTCEMAGFHEALAG